MTQYDDIRHFDAEEHQPRDEVVAYRDLVNRQIDYCRILLNEAESYPYIQRLMEAVETMRSLLIEFLDKNFEEKMKLLDERHSQLRKRYSPAQYDDLHLKFMKDYARSKFEYLISLATRRGFTVIKREKVNISAPKPKID